VESEVREKASRGVGGGGPGAEGCQSVQEEVEVREWTSLGGLLLAPPTDNHFQLYFSFLVAYTHCSFVIFLFHSLPHCHLPSTILPRQFFSLMTLVMSVLSIYIMMSIFLPRIGITRENSSHY